MYPERENAPPGTEPLQSIRKHGRLIATIVACSIFAVLGDPPSRLDLWVAELAGVAIVIGAAPVALTRVLPARRYTSALAMSAAMVVTLALTQREPSASDGGADHGPGKALPTASDGFGAYIRLGEALRNS